MLQERLNHALLFLGMYGDEMILQELLNDLAWIDRRDDQLGGVTQILNEAEAWSPTGVNGAFRIMFGGIRADHDAAAALVYADIAHAWGYLTPQRTLTPAQYARLRRDARGWTAGADHVMADLVGEFGEPSVWRPKYNRRFPTSVGYVSASSADPLIAFDFWQEARWHGKPMERDFGPEPVLRNVRWHPDGSFAAGFTFSPVGATLLVPSAPRCSSRRSPSADVPAQRIGGGAHQVGGDRGWHGIEGLAGTQAQRHGAGGGFARTEDAEVGDQSVAPDPGGQGAAIGGGHLGSKT